jgi:hypothetical protein
MAFYESIKIVKRQKRDPFVKEIMQKKACFSAALIFVLRGL